MSLGLLLAAVALLVVGSIVVVMVMPVSNPVEKALRKLPVTKIAEAGTGRVRLIGVVRALGDDKTLVASPYANVLGVYTSGTIVRSDGGNGDKMINEVTRQARFVLEDSSGSIEIDPTHARCGAFLRRVELAKEGPHVAFGAGIVARNAGGSAHYRESVVTVGATISVAGDVTVVDGKRSLAGAFERPLLIGTGSRVTTTQVS